MPSLPPDIQFMRAVLRDMAATHDTSTPTAKLGKKAALQPAGKILMAARFIRALKTPEAIRNMAAPMTVTAIVQEDSDQRGHFLSASEFILACLSDSVGADLMTDLKVIALEVSSMRDPTSVKEQFHTGLDDAILRGKSVLAVVSAPSDLSDAARALLTQTYDLPPVTGGTIAEVLRALGRAPSRKLAACLSDQDAGIARLPVTVVIGALRRPDDGRAVRIILEAVARLEEPERPEITLDDLHLPDPIEAHFRGIVSDIELWKSGKLAWEDVSCSTLLYGPPGCGKTSLARALAGSAGLHYVSGSYAEAQAAGSLSHYLRAMERRAAEAIGITPSLFFVDELDSLPDRTKDQHHNDAYMTSVVNHALELFTRLHRAPGVVLLAASNHLSKIDPALIRAGRLDTHLYVGPPDRAGIEEILRRRLSSAGAALDFSAASRGLVGMSGADVTTTATKAIGIARRAGRQMTDEDLSTAIHQAGCKSFDLQIHRIAIHEAGHAVVRAAVGLPLPQHAMVSVTSSHVAAPAPLALGLMEVEQLMATMLGGRAAEVLILGSASSGAETDIAQATSLALALETRICVGTLMPIYLPYSPDRPDTWPTDLQTAIRRSMARAQKLALRAVQVNIEVVRAVADALLGERELNAAQLQQLLQPVVSVPPASAMSQIVPADLFPETSNADRAPSTSDHASSSER